MGSRRPIGPFSQIQVLPTAAAFTIAAINWSLNINQGQGGTALPAFLNITAFPTVGGPDFLTGISLSTGENKFSLFGNAGEQFSSVLFNIVAADHTTPEDIDSLRQVEIGLPGVVINPQGGGVPEPASWATMILGLLRPGRCPAHPAAAHSDRMTTRKVRPTGGPSAPMSALVVDDREG